MIKDLCIRYNMIVKAESESTPWWIQTMVEPDIRSCNNCRYSRHTGSHIVVCNKFYSEEYVAERHMCAKTLEHWIWKGDVPEY